MSDDLAFRFQQQQLVNERLLAEIENLKQQNFLNSHSNFKPASFQLPPLDTFDGSRKKAKIFLAQLQIYFDQNPNQFEDDEAKIGFAISLFREAALKWISPYLGTDSPLLVDYENFVRSFKLMFDDSYLGRDAEFQIFNLRQGNRACSEYVSDFQNLMAELGTDYNFYFKLFYNGLRNDVKDAIDAKDRPATLEAYFDQAIRISNQVYYRGREKYAKQKKLYSAVMNSNNPHKERDTADQSTPMIVDSLKYNNPLSSAEKERRRQENLCLYCASPDHKIVECPLLPKTKNDNA